MSFMKKLFAFLQNGANLASLLCCSFYFVDVPTSLVYYSCCFVVPPLWCFTTPPCFVTLLPSQIPFCSLLFCCSPMLCCCSMLGYCSMVCYSFAHIGISHPTSLFCNVLEICNCLGGSLETSKLTKNFFCSFFLVFLPWFVFRFF